MKTYNAIFKSVENWAKCRLYINVVDKLIFLIFIISDNFSNSITILSLFSKFYSLILYLNCITRNRIFNHLFYFVKRTRIYECYNIKLFYLISNKIRLLGTRNNYLYYKILLLSVIILYSTYLLCIILYYNMKILCFLC